jgi:parallel beta-helix repeat protein
MTASNCFTQNMKHRPYTLAAAFWLLTPFAFAPVFAGTIDVAAGPNAQERLQAALIDAKPGDTVQIGAGRFDLTDGLSLDVDKVTVRGAGPGATILSFKGQKGAGEGLLITSDDVIVRGLAVEDSKGDGIKSKGANRIVYHDLRVEWTGGPKTTNGAYGLYPVESSDILIDKVTVKGASDAGIYVGQSKNIIVRNSVAMYNVAGIEIENSYGADVYSNIAMHNTGGILVFDLPNLPQMGGHNVRIFSNRIAKNDTPNFAPKGNIVASVPVGTGVMVMANRDVAVFGNVLEDNSSANVMLVSYVSKFDDKNYNPMPRRVTVRDNMHGKSGFAVAYGGSPEANAMLSAGQFAVLWDGLDSTPPSLRVTDKVPTLSMGFPRQGAGPNEAKPAPADLSGTAAMPEPPMVVLPAAMEAAIQ